MQIEKLFDHIRRTFYPQWDKKGEWSVKVVPSRDPRLRFAQGRCDEEARTILINEFQLANRDPEIVELLLVHEIAHAVTRSNHRKEWRKQMKRAGEIALSIGRDRLADLIGQQVAEYEQSSFSPP